MRQNIPSEFVGFVSDVARRAFDTLGEHVADLDRPIRAIVKTWTKLSDDDKDTLIISLISAVQGAPPPAADETPKKRSVKRYEPAEVEKTLPSAPKKKKRKTAAKKKKA